MLLRLNHRVATTAVKQHCSTSKASFSTLRSVSFAAAKEQETRAQREHSKQLVRKLDSQLRVINEEPVNYQLKSYERVNEYLQTQEMRRKKEEEDEEYRYEDKLMPRKNSTLRKAFDDNVMLKNVDQLLELFGFSDISPVVDKTVIETLQGMNPLISNFVLIDVRGRLAAKHYIIPGSVNIPLSELTTAFELTSADFRARYGVKKPDVGKSLIMFSEDEMETELACQFLSSFVTGYNLVYNYRGGIQDWFGATYKQLWRRSYISDYKLLLRYDRYGKIQRNMIRSVKELTEEE